MQIISCKDAAQLIQDGWLTLTEIAPGVDLERDVEAQLAAHVPVAPDLKLMDGRIFRDAPMLTGCDKRLITP